MGSHFGIVNIEIKPVLIANTPEFIPKQTPGRDSINDREIDITYESPSFVKQSTGSLQIKLPKLKKTPSTPQIS